MCWGPRYFQSSRGVGSGCGLTCFQDGSGHFWDFSEFPNLDEVTQILISLDLRHAENILSGRKDIELRTRKMNLEDRTRIWIYAKRPVAAVVGYASLRSTVRMSPRELWTSQGNRTGISEAEFFAYFADREYAHGLILESPFRLGAPISLTRLREVQIDFSPPQFFTRLDRANKRLRLLLEKQI